MSVKPITLHEAAAIVKIKRAEIASDLSQDVIDNAVETVNAAVRKAAEQGKTVCVVPLGSFPLFKVKELFPSFTVSYMRGGAIGIGWTSRSE